MSESKREIEMEVIKMETGTLLATKAIDSEMNNDPYFQREVIHCFSRYMSHDWGDLGVEDKKLNKEALAGSDRILAAYNTSKGKIYIITEWDRSVTTILFKSEY